MSEQSKCPACNGSGTIRMSATETITCDDCCGSGKADLQPATMPKLEITPGANCIRCRGSGFEPKGFRRKPCRCVMKAIQKYRAANSYTGPLKYSIEFPSACPVGQP